MRTNAGHYFYIPTGRNASHYGRDLPDYTFGDMIGKPGASLPKNPSINGIPYLSYFEVGRQCIDLVTTYPGMLIGVGYSHPIGEKNDADFQTGFYFDWTTGLPVIPGSSVKGALRSPFPRKGDDAEINVMKSDYLLGILWHIQNRKDPYPDQFLGKLKKTIFEGQRDIFHDAYLVGTQPKGHVFAEDYITPHKSPFSDPTPLRFLKIGPHVPFRFEFMLKPSRIQDETVSAKDKLSLFKQILLDFGIGAKRNTGYGALVEPGG